MSAMDAGQSQEGGAEADGEALGDLPGLSDGVLAAEVEELRGELERTRAASEERLADWKRARADYENLKRRSSAEVSERSAQATGALLLELLSVIDNFERAFETDRQDDPEAWAEGILLIRKDLGHFLDRLGVQPIAAEGHAFDPNYHEAVSQGPGPDNEVLAQVRKGYLLGARVLRPALVVVGQGGAASGSGDSASAIGDAHDNDNDTV
ncbi:MAG: molecular chaperone GrpE [Chloroflexi bacterium]|nr:MAG: molecular chaperone GrpE [Chloroflexota bacterium]